MEERGRHPPPGPPGHPTLPLRRALLGTLFSLYPPAVPRHSRCYFELTGALVAEGAAVAAGGLGAAGGRGGDN